MMSHKLIDQIKACEEIKVIRNPLIQALLRLSQEQQNAAVETLASQDIAVLWNAQYEVDQVALLSALWPQLKNAEKEKLIDPVRHVIKTQGIETLNFISKEDVDLIFKGYDLKALNWPWPETQALMMRFSKEERSEHMGRYFKPYMQSFSTYKPFAKWDAFLDPLSDKARYWIFKHLNEEDFNACFARIDFLFKYLTPAYRLAILQQRVSSDLIFNYINEDIVDDDDRLKDFLQKFNPEDRKEVIKHLEPEPVRTVLSNFCTFKETLRLFPQTDRLEFLNYLGKEFLQTISLEGADEESRGESLSFHLDALCKLLPTDHYITFLTSFDPDYLGLMNDKWSNVARITEHLTSDEDAIFFKYLDYAVIEQSIVKERRIRDIIYPLRKEKRIIFLHLIHKHFPALLEQIFVKGTNDKTARSFTSITELLPKKDYFSFFELFSEADLRELYNIIQHWGKAGDRLGCYLTTKDPKKEVALVRKETFNIFIAPEPLAVTYPVTPPDSNKILNVRIPTTVPKKAALFSHLPRRDRSEPQKLYFEELDKAIAGIKNDYTYNYFRGAVDILKTALLERFKKVCRQDKSIIWKSSSLKKITEATTEFINCFINTNEAHEKLAIIKHYENQIQPDKKLKTIGKCLAVVLITALCLVTGAALGLGLGALAGCWTGPGGVVTSFAGLFIGAAKGFTISSMAAGSLLGGIGGIGGASVSSFLFFKPTTIDKSVNQVITAAKSTLT
ncbi:MAG: hypothetical protein WC785_03010 [Tatlockia sp.]|jgi:hypothetical protein